MNRYRYSYSTSVVQIALDEIISNDSMVFYIGRSDLSEFEKRIETTGILPEEAPCLMIPIVSNMDPEAAPEGKQLMIVGGSAKLPHNAGAERWKTWEQAIMNALETVFPGIRRHILWTVSTTPEDIHHFGSEDGAVIGIVRSSARSARIARKSSIRMSGTSTTAAPIRACTASAGSWPWMPHSGSTSALPELPGRCPAPPAVASRPANRKRQEAGTFPSRYARLQAEPVDTSLNCGALTKGDDPKPGMQKERTRSARLDEDDLWPDHENLSG